MSSTRAVEAALAAAHAAHNAGEWRKHRPQPARTSSIALPISWRNRLCERIAYADAITTARSSTSPGMAQLAPFVFRSAANYIRAGHLSQKLPGKMGEVEYFRRPWGSCPAGIALERAHRHRLTRSPARWPRARHAS